MKLQIPMILVALLAGTITLAQNLTPEKYIDVEIQVRQLTVEGMQQRLFLLQLQGREEVLAQTDLDDDTRSSIEQVFSQAGVDAGSHLAYGTRSADEIDAYLKARPDQLERLNSVNAEFDRLSGLISSVIGNE